MKKENAKFLDWSNRWKAARTNIGAIDEVIALCKTTPTKWQRTDWEGVPGYRHNHKEGGGPRGEQQVEKQLLEGGVHEVVHGMRRYPLRVVYQKMPQANQSSGQRVADAFGLLTHQRTVHPVMLEVKTTDHDCWFALVECLQQTRMGRANERNIRAFAQRLELPEPKGVWGMVLAPSKYIKRSEDRGILNECRQLLCRLKPTQNRAAICETDHLNDRLIRIVESNWS